MDFNCRPRAKILLTGGTGFVGKALLRHILSTESHSVARITVLTRKPDQFLHTNPEFSGHQVVKFFKGDMLKLDTLPWDYHFTHVVHAAAVSATGPRLTPWQQYNHIVDGTRNILSLAVITGARRFLLTSSGAIYGPQPVNLTAISEDHLGCPPLCDSRTAYGQAKRAAEHLCALCSEANGLESVIARCFTFVGPDLPLKAHFAIGNFIHDALTADTITVASDGTPLRTYLDQTDLAKWLLTLLMCGRSGHAYNVGSNKVISIADLAHLVRDILAPDKPVKILGSPDESAIRSRYVPDIRKAQQELGLKINVALTESIQKTGEAFRHLYDP